MFRYTLVFIPLLLACAGLGDGKGDGLFDDTGGGSALDRDEDDDGAPDRTDCADQDPTVFPGAEEQPYDGVDNDCDPGTPDDDLDGDGFLLAEDCDDEARGVHPGATEVAGDGVDNDCDATSCLNPRFSETATAWDLPSEDYSDASYPFAELFDDNDCADGIPEFVTMDLTGDGVLDLVVLSDPCADSAVGRERWLVYEGGINGFAATPTRWALPAADFPGSLPFGEPSDDNDCADGIPEFVVTDLSGDGAPDLVVLQTPCADGAVGHDHWLVYEGGAGGFAAAPTPWTLPAADYADAAYPFIEILDDNDCADGIPEFAVTDLTGDGRADLVVLQAPCADGPIGRDFWRVYAGEAGGFASSATSWTLPADAYSDAAYPFIEIADDNDCADGVPEYVLSDMTGDGQADLLVVQSPCADDGVGRERWLVYAGGLGGFDAAPSDWSLPYDDYSSSAYPFAELVANNDCADGVPEYVTTELIADGFPDLVVLQAPCADDPTGRAFWKLYAGAAGGFASASESWGLPAGDFADATYPFPEYADNNDCADGVPEYATTHLNNDAFADLVVLQSPCADDAVGRASWSVYFGTCDL